MHYQYVGDLPKNECRGEGGTVPEHMKRTNQ